MFLNILYSMRKFISKSILFVSICLAAIIFSSCHKEQKLRILYWNIQNGMWDGQPDNYQKFTNWVKEQNPQICVWCESVSLYKDSTANPLDIEARFLPDGWQELAERYGHKYIYMGGHRDDYPQVITSVFPINNIKRIIGNDKDSIVTHGAGWATVEFAGKTINLVSLHTWPQKYAFGIGNEEREENKKINGGDKYRRMEMEYICKETILQSSNPNGEYWMMMGDFNAKSRVDNHFYNYPADTAAFLVHDYIASDTPYIDIIKEQYPDRFFTTTGRETRIDFVYCTPPVYEKIVSAQVISDDYTIPVRNPQKISNFWHPSDHRPILVELNF